jgi:hypothetical protein
MFAALFLALAVTADPLQISESAIDAGEVRVGPSLVRKFTFTNNGTEPLIITDVRSSCGCLVPALTKRVYPPGEHGEMTVEVNTLSQPAGPHRWTFSLAYRYGAAVGERPLELTATLKQEIEIVPAAIAFRGSNPPPAVVTVTDRRPKPLRVLAAGTSCPGLRAEIVPTGVRVSVTADCQVGQTAETVTLTTDDPDYHEIKLPVTIDREPKRRVTALPNRATLVAGGSAVVQLRGDEPVQVAEAVGSVPALTCRWAAGPGDRATVRIGLDRARWDGKPFTAEVRVRIKSSASETIVIPVSVRAED